MNEKKIAVTEEDERRVDMFYQEVINHLTDITKNTSFQDIVTINSKGHSEIYMFHKGTFDFSDSLSDITDQFESKPQIMIGIDPEKVYVCYYGKISPTEAVIIANFNTNVNKVVDKENNE